jgi:DNA invertase Pin-like site-specific DNA recombinase
MSKLRAVALYRASTKQQTDRDTNDIPTQKDIVKSFISKNKWELVKEFTEGGISGFKTSANDRDAVQSIKLMALNNEFDILAVYMADRIGRLSEETPLVIKFLNQHKIRVWSATEGEIKSDTHTDALLTFIRYWQSEGESLKTRQRVTDYQMASVEKGKYRGGSFIPYGYKLVNNGTKNFKGRNILDFVVDDKQSEVVKLIYKLSIQNNFGQSRIAKYLNEHGYVSPKGKGWSSSSIQSILNNQIYKGYMKFNSKLYNKTIYSEKIQKYVIIPEADWNKNQKMMKNRRYTKKTVVDKDNRVNNTHGSLLFSGLIYCGYCGMKLTTMTAYSRWSTKDGVNHRVPYHKYRCSSFYKKGSIECSGQSTYGKNTIEPIILDEIKNEIAQIQKEKIDQSYVDNINSDLKRENNKLQKLLNEIDELNNEIEVLKNEVTKSLLGKSKFSPELLQELLIKKNKEIEIKEQNISGTKETINDLNDSKTQYIQFGFNIDKWISEFDNAMDLEEKKAKIREVVKKIVVRKDEYEITYSLPIEKYIEKTHCKNTHHVLTRQVNIQPIIIKKTYKFHVA